MFMKPVEIIFHLSQPLPAGVRAHQPEGRLSALGRVSGPAMVLQDEARRDQANSALFSAASLS